MNDEGLFRALGGRDAYDVLGVPRGATRDEILRAKRERQLQAHPDLHGSDTGDADSKLINIAAAILADDRVRADYDRWSGRGTASQAASATAPSAWDAGVPGTAAPVPGHGGPPGPFPPVFGPRPPAPPAWAGPAMPGSSIPAGPMAMPAYQPSPSAASRPSAPAIAGLVILVLLVLCCGPGLCMPFLQR
ncbi:J domain-containing protein [Catenuloplanes atrovinosus]|uniref:J domain-containing protein n=1 Tax=Catenuloplanes atrovinosus TaxID=137266 RepID=A0AAE3YNP0_9ACTN|nr:J domain-containing protein [Catenuloplanes atrovinosus]MDR7275409.1 hypothetical protein [Catenuloplanes atrovinosus]